MTQEGHCPKCDTQFNYEDEELREDDFGRSYSLTCKKCGFEGYECHDLVFVGFVDLNGVWVE